MFATVSLRNLWLIGQWELTRLFLTKRGIVLSAAVAFTWYMLLKYPIQESILLIKNQQLSGFVTLFSDYLKLDFLLSWFYTELAVYWLFAMYIFPIIIIMMCCDPLASDLSRGTLRFLSLRVSRFELLLGRLIGHWLIINLFIITTLLAAQLLGVMRDPSQALLSLSQFIFVAINLNVVSLPFIALMLLFNSLVSSAKISIALTVITLPLFSALIAGGASHVPSLDWLHYLLPGAQITQALQSSNYQLATVFVPLAQTLLYLGLSHLFLTRRSL